MRIILVNGQPFMKRILFTLALALTGVNAFAQTITGRLVDDGGQPVAFANVVLFAGEPPAHQAGTTTGEDGSFSVEVPNGTYRLEASYVLTEVLEREEQRKDEHHHDAHEDLQRQTYLYIVHEGVLSC